MKNRLTAIEKSLSDGEALLIENPIDLFYLTNEEFSAGSLLIKNEGSTLFLDGRYTSVGEKLQLPLLNRTDDLLAETLGPIKTLQIDSQYTSWERGKKIESLLNGKSLVATPAPLMPWRKKKEASEIGHMQKAAKITDLGFDFIISSLREGITEQETALILEAYFLEEHGAHTSFDPIVAFGANSANPHAKPSNRPLKRGDIVLLDFGAKIDHYCADMTRTFFFGHINPRLDALFETVLEAQKRAINLLKPGISPESLDQETRSFLTEKGFQDAIKHSLGHGIGLEVHEPPIFRINTPSFLLEEGLCITIEPGLYIPGLGGVRIEDTLLITEMGATSLTKSSKQKCYV